ncbi:hypothetical protein MRB53_040391 [Persea americana]|nr:hypothetical protein MRB53_040391 [Persea americana]
MELCGALQTDADEDALALDVDVGNCELVGEGHDFVQLRRMQGYLKGIENSSRSLRVVVGQMPMNIAASPEARAERRAIQESRYQDTSTKTALVLKLESIEAVA